MSTCLYVTAYVLYCICVQLDRATDGSTLSVMHAAGAGRCYSMSGATLHPRRAVSTCEPPTGLSSSLLSTIARSPAPGTASACCYRYTSLHSNEHSISYGATGGGATGAQGVQGAVFRCPISPRKRADTLDVSPARPRHTYTRREAEELHLLRSPQTGWH